MLDLSTQPKIKGAKHWFQEINQLYHPTSDFEQDSQEIVYSSTNFNESKFFPILLKEWFYLAKENGYLVIDYHPNKICNWKKLETTMWWLWKGQYDIVFHGTISTNQIKDLTEESLTKFIKEQKEYYKKNLDEKTLLPKALDLNVEPKQGECMRFICRKKRTTKLENDSIDKWTFGIITNGTRLDWIEKIIKSIRSQEVPRYQIIICGSYFDRKEEDIKYIPFNRRNALGWISKKKNLIVEASQYENICIIHDRIIFDENWYKGMKKRGNCFEHLGCPQYYEGKRINDWLLHEKLEGEQMGYFSSLEFKDWDANVVQGGQLHIAKKTYLKEVPWNESFHWGEPEDAEISERLTKRGYLLRLNKDSQFDTLFHRFGKGAKFPKVPYNSKQLSSKRVGSFKRIYGRKIYNYCHKIPLLKATLLKIGKLMHKV